MGLPSPSHILWLVSMVANGPHFPLSTLGKKEAPMFYSSVPTLLYQILSLLLWKVSYTFCLVFNTIYKSKVKEKVKIILFHSGQNLIFSSPLSDSSLHNPSHFSGNRDNEFDKQFDEQNSE